MYASIAGRATLADLVVLVSAEASNGGWAFSGSASVQKDGAPGMKLGAWLVATLGLSATTAPSSASIPSSLDQFEIHNVLLELHTANHDVRFEVACSTLIGEHALKLDARLVIHYTQQLDESYSLDIGGHLSVGYRDFQLVLERSEGGSRLIAIYASESSESLDLGELISMLSGDAAIPGLNISLSAIELGLDSGIKGTDANGKAASALVLGVDMGGTLDLARLPLVGGLLSGDQSVSMTLQVLYSRTELDVMNQGRALLNAINTHLPQHVSPLPSDEDLDAGFRLTPKLQVGNRHFEMNLPVGASSRSGQITETDSPPGTGAVLSTADKDVIQAGNTSWIPVQKHFGPAYLSRIGARYAKSELTFMIDAALSVGPLTLSLDGLSVSTPLTEIKPTFQLGGLGLSVDAEAVSISGCLLHERIGDDEVYSGAALLRFEELAISAIGSYAEVNGQKSLFLYAVLDYPIGGPAFFFIEGLAAGFGYNRAFIPPPITNLEHFPLIVEARRGAGLPQDVGEELRKLQQYIPIRSDQYFLVAGIKFNSFKLIDSIVMVAVSFGKHFEIDVLGISTLVLPAPDIGSRVSPIAVAEMVVRAVYDPDAGLIEVEATLTPRSHIFSGACKLTGGFVFRSWFSGSHNGDFVLSLGGFHPHYRPPAHYLPAPEPVKINWHYNNDLQLKGDLYCALTPAAVMAGGHLKATYHKNRVDACFQAGADFLLQWKPYHYEASIYINVSGTYHRDLLFVKKISIDVGASLQLWGPELAGIATVDLYVTSVDIHFGAALPAPQPLTWGEFVESFLPADSVVSTTVASGLIETISDESQEIALINPQELHLVSDSAIPSRSEKNIAFSPAPMRISAFQFHAEHTVTLTDEAGNDITDSHFLLSRRYKPMPKALWEDRSFWPADQKADLTEREQMLDPTHCGFDIRARPPRVPGSTENVPKDSLIQPDRNGIARRWQAFNAPEYVDQGAVERRDILSEDIFSNEVVHAREELMRNYGLSPDLLDIRTSVAGAFRVAPGIAVSKGLIA